jgi:hypothetical protein
MPKKEPIGRKKRSPPNAASLNPNCILISGIRLAQLAKQIPVRKKYPERIILLVFSEIGVPVMAQRWGFYRNWAIFAVLTYFNSLLCIVHTIVEH